MVRWISLALWLAASVPALAQSDWGAGKSAAFLGITFLDTSTEGDYFGERADERARIGLLEETVRERLRQEGLALSDLSPVAEELERTVNPAKCYGCDLRMGRKLGADFVVVGEVQKVSNLILSMNLVVRDAESGAMVRGQSVEIRSNTDASWLRGIRYILNNNIFKE
ncbi:DUF3280 domain-containing protein [Poseidonocella sedimentorum]|uniref:DUF2380 domain-containing protein n=1 Tax=Poseidonocella sedimentorum TaxID=871652 RepID=A0A1I6D3L3_9RHOB|nr:DUF3280 domain-containing protein [Poseidonocella sedimentorum]SFR00056.1 Protein of unknown function [Poseidonocella sedimentorum]